MPPVLESDMHSREYLAEQKRKGEAYLKERNARIAERKAAEQESLKDIQSIARSLVYSSAPNAQLTQKAQGADDCSDSEYDRDAEEEAYVEEEDLRDEEEVALAKSKAMEALSNKPPNITHENWTSLVNKWSDERNKKICQMNKENREAVRQHQKTGSMSYVSYFSKLKKDKYNNHDPSPIEFFKDTHTNSKTDSMS
ncbi:uncharacterized protein [Triticum aestivum]|uniref:uncharacterized protein n=1 Tax=Triticum aestivum TaxID=4565 RepID=UPI001D00FD03|nr:uncharacterized protein LOC123086416 [Triticum aestivum]